MVVFILEKVLGIILAIGAISQVYKFSMKDKSHTKFHKKIFQVSEHVCIIGLLLGIVINLLNKDIFYTVCFALIFVIFMIFDILNHKTQTQNNL